MKNFKRHQLAGFREVQIILYSLEVQHASDEHQLLLVLNKSYMRVMCVILSWFFNCGILCKNGSDCYTLGLHPYSNGK